MTETKNTDMATARKLTRIAQNLQALVGMMALVNISDELPAGTVHFFRVGT